MLRNEISKHLRTKGSITRLEALGLYGCMDVTTVIRDLRKRIKDHPHEEIITDIKVDTNGKRYARYVFRDRRETSTM